MTTKNTSVFRVDYRNATSTDQSHSYHTTASEAEHAARTRHPYNNTWTVISEEPEIRCPRCAEVQGTDHQ